MCGGVVMNKIDYSVVIRTTGKAHEKYQSMLSSIDALNIKPVEVIVVLPEGNELPKEQLGYEKYYFSPKGMVIQRMKGIECCKTKYALICDDDVAFENDFVEKLYEPLAFGIASFSAAPLYSFLPPKGLNSMLCTIMGSAVPTVFHRKDRYVSILKTSGYSYNRHLDVQKKYYETQSIAWTCFFADVAAFKSLELEKECWLDAHGYSSLDDQTMFYKAWLMGYKTVVVSNAHYEHLDGKTSTRNNKSAVLYSMTFNRVVFWHRFIYSMQKTILSKVESRIAFVYRMQWACLWDYISVLRRKMTVEDYKISCDGYKEGWKYIMSKEYKSLPDIKKI